MMDFEYEVDMIVESYLDEFEPVHEIGDTPAGQRALVKVADRANARIGVSNRTLTSLKNDYKPWQVTRKWHKAHVAAQEEELEKLKKNRANAVKWMSKDTLANNSRWAEPN